MWRVMRWLYLIAAILGTILPLSQFYPFVATYGFDLTLFFRQLFQTPVSAFFGMDVIVSSLALWLFVFSEGRRRGMKNLWLYVVCNLAVGVSLALPLFLFFRERKLNAGVKSE
jgi:Terpene cyclase DEP1